MNIKRISALILAVILVFSLVGCGKKKREIVQLTLSTEDSEAILKAAGIMLPDAETAAGANSSVKYFSWYDQFHNYSDDEIINTGFWTFTEKYGGEVMWIECEWQKRFDDLANLVLSGNAPDCYPAHAENFPENCIKGMFQPVDEYIDYDNPIWKGMKEYVHTYYSLDDRPYIILTDTSYGGVVQYNKRVVEEWGFDDPAELFYNDEWTWDVFYDMCADFTDPDEDRYALDSFHFDHIFLNSSGVSVISYDTETKRFKSNLDDPRLERAADVLYNISKNSFVYPWWANGWALRNGTSGGGIKEGLQLFYVDGLSISAPVENVSAVFGDVAAGEVMFCPPPRDPNGDGKYYIDSTPVGYSLVFGAENPEGVALLAMCDRFKVLDPTVISIDRKQKEEVYLWNEEMLEMHDICYELSNAHDSIVVSMGDGLGKHLIDVVSQFEYMARGQSSTAKTWAQLKEANLEKITYYLDELNKSIDEFDPEAQ